MNAPLAAAQSLPAALYRDPAVWAAERTAIFARSWQFVAHESDLPETGSWVAEVVAGFPVLVVRDEQGTLRGFHNVCRHRAGPLTDGPSGRCEKWLTCRYHGWTYALDGRLRNARDFGPSAGFDPRDYGLFPLRVETWRGLVFVALSDDIAPLAEELAPVEARLGAADWGSLRVAARQAHPLACNWKTYVENYLEGYHIPVLHPGLDAEVDSARYGVRVEGRVAIHEAPPRGEKGVYEGVWAWLWPNTALNIYGRGLMLERISPDGHAATRLDYLYLTPDGEPVAEQTLAMAAAVVAEDRWVVERVQQNLEAGVYETGRLSPRHEGAVAAFQDLVRAALG
ncbi:MAG: Rieske (2Fe-2S) protein [Phenylobacterium sp.]|nr:MAG: Rieske (2Fe-2S) protein [Phenylobacterium sp.]